MQPEIEPPSVQATAQALQRLRMSEDIREEVGIAHSYPLRDEDEWTVESFYGAYGELPPENYLKRLWWFWRS